MSGDITKFPQNFIEQQRELAANATPRPWNTWGTISRRSTGIANNKVVGSEVIDICYPVNNKKNNWEINAYYIVEAANNYPDALDEIEKLRARIAELESQTRWIPVSERLPEEGQNVAALDNGDHCVDVWRYSSLIVDYFSRHFSHWMPWEKWLEITK